MDGSAFSKTSSEPSGQRAPWRAQRHANTDLSHAKVYVYVCTRKDVGSSKCAGSRAAAWARVSLGQACVLHSLDEGKVPKPPGAPICSPYPLTFVADLSWAVHTGLRTRGASGLLFSILPIPDEVPRYGGLKTIYTPGLTESCLQPPFLPLTQESCF